MGRMKSDGTRNRSVRVRLNEKEYTMLHDILDMFGMTMSEFIRDAIAFYYNYYKRIKQ